MKVSICITYYNQKEFVKQSLESILAIDFPCDFEILCGDDGSSDGTLEIIREYQKKYPNNIKYFVRERNENIKTINRASLNRLNLLSHAKGNYIMFVDGDDFFCDTKFIKEALQIFENDKEIEICAFNFKYLYKDGSGKVFWDKKPEGIINNKRYIAKGMYTHAGACVFKNIIDKEKLEFLNKINSFDDNAIVIYMLQFGKLYYINRPIYVYRQTDNGLWSGVNNVEQNLINAFALKLISDSAPMFTKEITKREFLDIQAVYQNRKELKVKLGKKFDKYVEFACKNKDIFIKNLLTWNTLNFIEKLKTMSKYKQIEALRIIIFLWCIIGNK